MLRGPAVVVVATCLLLLLVVSPGACDNLTCYTCYTEDEQDDCNRNVSRVDTMTCDKERYCSVYRMDTNGVFTFIARGCNVTCQTQCSTWGDEDYEDYCTSCCQTSLCNVDSAASHHFTTWTLSLLVVVTSWLVLGTATGGDNQEAGRG